MEKKNSIYGIITLIIFVTIIILYIYYNENNFLYEYTYKEDDFVKNKKSFDIYEYYDIKPICLDRNNAIVIYGEIPYDCFYWGFYINNINKTISSKNYETEHSGDSICLIITCNEKIFEEINISLKKKIRLLKKAYKIVPIIVPIEYENKEFSIFLHKINKINIFENNFVFKYKIYNFTKTKYKFIENDSIIMNNIILSSSKQNDFNIGCREIIEKYKLIKEVYPFLSDNIAFDRLSFNSEIKLNKDEQLIIIACDHSIRGKSIFSNILINNKTSYITGNVYVNKNFIDKIIVQVIKHNERKINIEENIYYNPITKERPLVEEILPMKLFICQI